MKLQQQNKRFFRFGVRCVDFLHMHTTRKEAAKLMGGRPPRQSAALSNAHVPHGLSAAEMLNDSGTYVNRFALLFGVSLTRLTDPASPGRRPEQPPVNSLLF